MTQVSGGRREPLVFVWGNAAGLTGLAVTRIASTGTQRELGSSRRARARWWRG